MTVLSLLALATALAAPAMTDPDGDHHLLPGRREGPDEIRASWTWEDGFWVSPVRSWITGGTRFGALVEADPETPLELEVRGVSPAGEGPWVRATETWRDDGARVIVAELGAHWPSAQARARGLDGLLELAWEIRVPVYEPRRNEDLPPPPSSALSSTLEDLGVVSRDEWGSRDTECSSTEDDWYRTAIHHTAGSQTYGGTVAGAVRALQAYAMDSGEYCDIPYQFLVGYDGTLWEGRELTYTSGATGGGNNDGNIAICFLGCYHPDGCGDTPDDATDAMIAWARLLLETLAEEHDYEVDEDTVKGHRDWPGNATACPGEYVYDRLDEVRSGTAPYEATLASQTWPVYGVDAPLTLAVGETYTGSFTFTNEGTETWTAGGTYLAPMPRDTASSLAHASWPSSTRAATLGSSVAPGGSGTFSFTVEGVAEGEYVLTFGLVQEWVTWFADVPYGGGPEDGSVALHVVVNAASSGGGTETGAGGAETGEADPVADSGGADSGLGEPDDGPGGGDGPLDTGSPTPGSPGALMPVDELGCASAGGAPDRRGGLAWLAGLGVLAFARRARRR